MTITINLDIEKPDNCRKCRFCQEIHDHYGMGYSVYCILSGEQLKNINNTVGIKCPIVMNEEGVYKSFHA